MTVAFNSAELGWISSFTLACAKDSSWGGAWKISVCTCSHILRFVASCLRPDLFMLSTLPTSFNDCFFLFISFGDSVRQQFNKRNNRPGDSSVVHVCDSGFWFSVCLGFVAFNFSPNNRKRLIYYVLCSLLFLLLLLLCLFVPLFFRFSTQLLSCSLRHWLPPLLSLTGSLCPC